MEISCVIITKNEEKNIERCLKSLQNVADEIIVIDSYSTDNTEAICQKYNVRFERLEWQGYSETKNYGNALARHSYILSVDADEALSEELVRELLKLKKNEGEADAYFVNRITNYCGKWIKHCGWFPDWKLRLWKKGVGSWTGNIHEQFDLIKGTRTKKMKSLLLHYSYYTTDDHRSQIERYATLMAEDNYRRGKKASLLKIAFSPVVKFLNTYFLRLGFLDGYYGFKVCAYSSYATWLKYSKTRKLYN